MTARSNPASPCVSICALDENDLCIGCLRTGDEISGWVSMTPAEKHQVMNRVSQREEASGLLLQVGKK